MAKTNMRPFVEAPDVKYGRSVHNLSHEHDFTCNVGELIPFLVDEVYPGDNVNIGVTDLTRMMTLINPIFGDLFNDFYVFYIPYRVLWEHFVNFLGENDSTYWTQPTTYSIPQVTSPSTTGWQVGTLADYLGCRCGVGDISVSALFFRAYAKVVNDWFRDENLNTPCNCPVDDTTIVGSNGSDPVTDIVKGGRPFIAPKMHDYFSSALPEPQKGDPVTIGIGDTAPVTLGKGLDGYTDFKTGDTPILYMYPSRTDLQLTTIEDTSSALSSGDSASLMVDLSQASAITINDLRYSFAVQRLLEKQSRLGSRMIEILYGSFGVKSPDARLQRSEYLGGKRVSLDINTIVQTGESGATPLGSTAGYSATMRSFDICKKSIQEHGVILGLVCTRYIHSYSQGMAKMWFRKNKYDFYWPELANIGEQPIYNKEIYMQGNSQDDEVFGYQEAWNDLRYKPNRVSGYLRPELDNSLKSWTLTDNYNSLPTLGSAWLKEDVNNVNRVIAVSSDLTHQLLHSMNIKYYNTRVLPTHSIPRIIG